jgi:hypothetical protein
MCLHAFAVGLAYPLPWASPTGPAASHIHLSNNVCFEPGCPGLLSFSVSHVTNADKALCLDSQDLPPLVPLFT